ncbi:MAG TPA: hypothetical protein VGD89_13815 [Flavipsychrobacter sp.]
MEHGLEKRLWTDADFEEMCWHDNLVYKIHAGKDLELDIDYIVKWNMPEVEGLPFSFWVAPATLVFINVRQLTLDINFYIETDISEIVKEEVDGETRWTIVNHEQGDITFLCDGFQQFIRQEPVFQYGQNIPMLQRNGISLERTINQHNPNINTAAYNESRKMDAERYETLKARLVAMNELKALEAQRENAAIAFKAYLIRRRDLRHEIARCNTILKDKGYTDL